METVKKVENRGGARPGAGRPVGSGATLGAAQVRALLEIVEKRSEKEGKRPADVILDVVYNVGATNRDRLTACKLISDMTMVKISEGGEADRQLAPTVFLPEHRPALSVVPGGKSE